MQSTNYGSSLDDASSGTRCRKCGAFVTSRFARVFGDNEDEVNGCLECRTAAQLFAGHGGM